MRRGTELRAAFGDEPFDTREARRLGFSARELRHPGLAVPHSGVRSLHRPGESLYERALALLPRLSEGCRFSHVTALALLGCPIRVPLDAPVDVEGPPGADRVRRKGVAGHRRSGTEAALPLRVPDTDRLVPIAPPGIALLQASAVLPFGEIVVAIDALVLEPRRLFDPTSGLGLARLRAWADGVPPARGVRRVRAAVKAARVGAQSRMETLARLAGERVGQAGLSPQLEVRGASGERPAVRLPAALHRLLDERSDVPTCWASPRSKERGVRAHRPPLNPPPPPPPTNPPPLEPPDVLEV